MLSLEGIASHVRRISYHLGRRATFGNHRFKLAGYYASRLESSEERHEPNLTAVLKRQLESRSGAFIDIGVNVGQTLLKVLGVDRNRAYIGFEPQIACCYNVEQFLRLNQLQNAVLLPIALSDADGIMTFHSSGEFDEMASLIAAKLGHSPSIKSHVQARIGDDVLRELGVDDICAIKIDVEGAELQVLRGLRKTLAAKRPALVFEVLPNFHGFEERVMHPPALCASNQAAADAIYDLLSGIGYDIFQIDGMGAETKIARFELDDRQDYVGANYIAHAQTFRPPGSAVSQ